MESSGNPLVNIGSIVIYFVGRVKIIGEEKCPRCPKLGRYNPKPMISWNNQRIFDKKRKYFQFIHNDGTRHNLPAGSGSRTTTTKDRRTIYNQSQELERKLWWYRRSPLYQEIYDFIHIEVPFDQAWLEGLYRVLQSETVDMIISERLKLIKSHLLRLHDEEELLELARKKLVNN